MSRRSLDTHPRPAEQDVCIRIVYRWGHGVDRFIAVADSYIRCISRQQGFTPTHSCRENSHL